MKIWLYEVDFDHENMRRINVRERVNVKERDLVEAILFNYMSQLEEVDKGAYVVVHKHKEDGEDCFQFTSYRTNWFTIEINEYEKISDRFVRYITTYNDYSECYGSFFDINIPCAKTFKLVKDCNDLYIAKYD
jgi:hypothetical protein